MSKSFTEHSRTEWQPAEEGGYPGHDRIQLGCLQRIANATELMAKDRGQLLTKLKWAEESRDYNRSRAEKLERKIAALKGVITKLKKKLNASTN